jgi:dTDP-glucose 4,6-dehydratase
MKSFLITGGAGFIGSNFILHFHEKYAGYKLINLDKLTYAGDLENIADVADSQRYLFVEGDINDRPLVESLFEEHDIQGVIHFAAESHVDNSISGPETFIKTNINGTFTLLEVARGQWMQEPFVKKSRYEHARFLHISTDEVYGSLGPTGLFTETTPYAPNSPYSASKAASDMLVRSYYHTYGLDVVTTNCSNNYGPRQHDEKLIPVIIRNAIRGNPIPVYGDGENVRDWLFVMDHCRGIDLVFHKGRSGETYNVGGNNERTNNQIVRVICDILDEKKPREDGKSYSRQITYVRDRAGHDRRYAIDSSKIQEELGWKQEEDFESGIFKTVDWYLNRY